MKRRLALALGLTLLAAAPARAHDAPFSFLNVRFTPHAVEGTLTAHVLDLTHELVGATPDSLAAA
ncbi:MAG: hypothetical protein ABI960_07370, partial [Candidatus Eisenbacteria bacterium]